MLLVNVLCDFFCDAFNCIIDHMAKVKDRLIFEGKKIEAVAQRKSNKEQKLRAKESQSNKLAEKSKRKREHFQQVEEWANSAAKQRGGALRDDADDQYMNGGGRNNNNRNNDNGPNKKRQIADRKFGFGGKTGRFKQNDRQSMNDMSGFNRRGNFAEGMKKTSSKSKGSSGAGAGRTGKRARDAKRARK
jgi:rRNA-processing protein EBP2